MIILDSKIHPWFTECEQKLDLAPGSYIITYLIAVCRSIWTTMTFDNFMFIQFDFETIFWRLYPKTTSRVNCLNMANSAVSRNFIETNDSSNNISVPEARKISENNRMDRSISECIIWLDHTYTDRKISNRIIPEKIICEPYYHRSESRSLNQ